MVEKRNYLTVGSPNLKKEARRDHTESCSNSTTNGLCNEATSRGDVGCGNPVTRMRDSTMDGQDKFIMRESDNAEVGAREDCDEDLLDVGCNVDLYVANHESADLLYEEQVGDALSTSNESGQDFVQFRSLSLD